MKKVSSELIVHFTCQKSYSRPQQPYVKLVFDVLIEYLKTTFKKTLLRNAVPFILLQPVNSVIDSMKTHLKRCLQMYSLLLYLTSH